MIPRFIGGEKIIVSPALPGWPHASLTLLELQSHCGENPLKFQVVCPQIGTAVLKGLNTSTSISSFERQATPHRSLRIICGTF